VQVGERKSNCSELTLEAKKKQAARVGMNFPWGADFNSKKKRQSGTKNARKAGGG